MSLKVGGIAPLVAIFDGQGCKKTKGALGGIGQCFSKWAKYIGQCFSKWEVSPPWERISSGQGGEKKQWGENAQPLIDH